MKILVLADLHYALRQLDWIKAQSGKYDLVVIAGDVLDLGSAVDLEVQVVVIEKYLRQFAAKNTLLVSSGNHDLTEMEGNERVAQWLEETRSDRILVDRDSLEIGGHLFTVCPWWDGPLTRAAAEKVLEADSAKPRKTWTWIHHNPPDQTPVSWTGKTFGGDPDLIQWIDRFKPDFILSGHIHNSPFYAEGSWICKVGSAWVFNTGKQIGPEPTYIVFDPDERRACWSSMEGKEERDLP